MTRLLVVGRRLVSFVGIGLAALELSCAGPYYERAAISESLSGGVGIGMTVGEGVPQEYNGIDASRVVVRDVSVLGTAYVRSGWSTSSAFFMQATAGRRTWFREGFVQDSTYPNELVTDIQLGAKFRVGSSGAVKAGIGYPGLLDVAYLHDFGAPLTAVVGVGLRGLTLGVTHHLNISPTILQHTSLTVAAFPFDYDLERRHWVAGAFIGLGWEFLTPPEDGDREELDLYK